MNYFRAIAAASVVGLVLIGGSAARGDGAEAAPWNLGDAPASPGDAFKIVDFGGRRVLFTASLFRNMMPPVGPDSSGIQTRVTASTEDSRGLPTGLVIRSVRLVQRRQTWTGPLMRLGVADRPDVIMRFATGGPMWEPGSRADAVVEFQWQRRIYRITLRGAVVHAAY